MDPFKAAKFAPDPSDELATAIVALCDGWEDSQGFREEIREHLRCRGLCLVDVDGYDDMRRQLQFNRIMSYVLLVIVLCWLAVSFCCWK